MNSLITATPELSGNRVQALVTKKGKDAGNRVFFGKQSVSEMRATGKKLGLKGAALTTYVNNGLQDGEANKMIAMVAIVQKAATEGYVADYMDVRKKSAVLRFVKPSAPKVVKSALELLAEEHGVDALVLEAALAGLTKK